MLWSFVIIAAIALGYMGYRMYQKSERPEWIRVEQKIIENILFYRTPEIISGYETPWPDNETVSVLKAAVDESARLWPDKFDKGEWLWFYLVYRPDQLIWHPLAPEMNKRLREGGVSTPWQQDFAPWDRFHLASNTYADLGSTVSFPYAGLTIKASVMKGYRGIYMITYPESFSHLWLSNLVAHELGFHFIARGRHDKQGNEIPEGENRGQEHEAALRRAILDKLNIERGVRSVKSVDNSFICGDCQKSI